jgi:hypothetical protein
MTRRRVRAAIAWSVQRDRPVKTPMEVVLVRPSDGVQRVYPAIT